MVLDIRANLKTATRNARNVRRAIDRTKPRAMRRIGAFIRRSARSSIRRRKKASKVGRPPSSHQGSLKKGIAFNYDPIKEELVVGPSISSGKKAKGVPRLVEEGGQITRIMRRRDGGTETVVIRYHARPYMAPALAKEIANPRLMRAWKDSVR